ncbi:glycoside hydrolase family 1 protein [Schleiferilactobacillus shenzhenensis]|uniref:Putative beta-glucosidase 9 n=1 Tax=Schleiferilactobacillus shenzhenensis LY-73 TaxID=1231336 RepID=U4TWH3_9LACO|nr:glycoside hydrolase family 1 protein [Schleiferilactobacillus shenzhenensis]ERL65732.1 Putative beta-glucosidase 9 [Schleiferilactobacillus shenzhenensis LY-73]
MTAFPTGFLWGNSVSAVQTEGAWNTAGKGPSVYDERPATDHSSDWHTAIDAYHRYPEDIAIMKDLGLTCYRFSISWSRVQPAGTGAFNEAGIAFYDRLIDDLLAAGITPMICLYHFDMPLALAQAHNGFISRAVVDAFVVYAQEMLRRFADRVPYWLTFNEQNLYGLTDSFIISGYQKGAKTLHDLYQIQHNVALAHALVTQAVHQDYPGVKIGAMIAHQQIYPATPHPQDVWITQQYRTFVNDNVVALDTAGRYLPQVAHFMESHGLGDILKPAELAELAGAQSDFAAMSYYWSSTFDHTRLPADTAPNWYNQYAVKKNPYLEANAWGWQIDPMGFRSAVNSVYQQTGLPIFPIENGIAAREHWDGQTPIADDYRIAYHRDHLRALQAAISEDGVPVIGYLGWGWLDIPSSQGDMEKRYGVVYVNRGNHNLRDLARVPKQSYPWLQEVIRTNGAHL